MLEIGTRIKVNNGLIETLVEVSRPYGLFKSEEYTVVRNLSKITEKDLLMNATINQDGAVIFCIGSERSHIRLKEEYNITIPKLINHINNCWDRTGLARHADHNDLVNIAEDDGIFDKSLISDLIRSAYFYSNVK